MARLGGARGAMLGSFLGDKASNYVAKKWKGRGLYSGRGSYNSLVAGGDSSMSGAGDETEPVTFSNRSAKKELNLN